MPNSAAFIIEKSFRKVGNIKCIPVSYTHLDVYKRQAHGITEFVAKLII